LAAGLGMQNYIIAGFKNGPVFQIVGEQLLKMNTSFGKGE
jgi:hypothetical protein